MWRVVGLTLRGGLGGFMLGMCNEGWEVESMLWG